VLRQQPRYVCLHALFQLGVERQAPVIKQIVIDTRRTVLGITAVADQQHLPTFLQPFELALLETVFDTRRVAAAKAVGLAMQPRSTMLRAQAGQAVAEKTCGQALEPRHLGQGT